MWGLLSGALQTVGEAGARTFVCSQTLSPYNKGLIKRAISQSGVALSPWAIQKNPLSWAKTVRRSWQGAPSFLLSVLDPISPTPNSAYPQPPDCREGGLPHGRHCQDGQVPEDH